MGKAKRVQQRALRFLREGVPSAALRSPNLLLIRGPNSTVSVTTHRPGLLRKAAQADDVAGRFTAQIFEPLSLGLCALPAARGACCLRREVLTYQGPHQLRQLRYDSGRERRCRAFSADAVERTDGRLPLAAWARATRHRPRWSPTTSNRGLDRSEDPRRPTHAHPGRHSRLAFRTQKGSESPRWREADDRGWGFSPSFRRLCR
jgi:hypothetical protein